MRLLILPLLFLATTLFATESAERTVGSATAPVTLDVYSDFQCPHCARLHFGALKEALGDCVASGKVRIVYHDFPLPQHPFAKLAARYANAAGETGHYEEVVKQLFASQAEWAVSGKVDAAVAQVLSGETMRKVRALVESDPGLDATVSADLSMAGADRINQTPTIVFVYKGARQKVVGAPSADLLRRYLGEMLK